MAQSLCKNKQTKKLQNRSTSTFIKCWKIPAEVVTSPLKPFSSLASILLYLSYETFPKTDKIVWKPQIKRPKGRIQIVVGDRIDPIFYDRYNKKWE